MNTLIKNLNKIFSKYTDYKFINKINNKKLRNMKNGLSLEDVIFYELSYCNQDSTRESIIAKINMNKKTTFTRHSFESKSNNISLSVFDSLLKELILLYDDTYRPIKRNNLIAVDGTNNLDSDNNIMLNMVQFDITNQIPIDITYEGSENRNREVKCLISNIKDDPDKYKSAILVGDRAYFSYELINFLIEKDIKFIIRIKGNGDYIDDKVDDPDKVRIVRCKGIIEKLIHPTSKKRHIDKPMKISLKNDCNILTTLSEDYDDDQIIKYYRSRWNVETFIAFIKYNFKFSHMNSKHSENHKKMYVCDLILTFIMKLITQTKIKHLNELNEKDSEYVYKINNALVIDGIFNSLLHDIIYHELDRNKLDLFISSYIKIHKNKLNRSFIRKAKRPHQKWSNKGYSDMSKYERVIDAILDNTINKLNKNLKVIANKILKITTIDDKVLYEK